MKTTSQSILALLLTTLVSSAVSIMPVCAGAGGGPDSVFLSGGRPSLVYLPTFFDQTKEHSLLIALHGFTDSAAYFVEQKLALDGLVEMDRLIVVAPEGSIHPVLGVQFWNAMPSCCGFEPVFGPLIDDSSFLANLVDELIGSYPIDPARIYFVGGSNGGAMAYRFALDHPDKLSAAVSIAGTFNFPSLTSRSAVSILQVHGTDDPNAGYFGGQTVPGWEFTAYPGANEVVAYWAWLAGSDGPLSPYGRRIDLDESIPGPETERQRYRSCRENIFVELWTIHGGGHGIVEPVVTEDGRTTMAALAVWNWLRTKRK